MTRSVYVASPEGLTGKSAVALGLLDALTREVGSVGVFRPLTTLGATADRGRPASSTCSSTSPASRRPTTRRSGSPTTQARENPDEALHVIVERFGELSDRFEVVLVLGSDYTDVSTGTELPFNARIAANLGVAGGAGGARPRPHARPDPRRRRRRHRRAARRPRPDRRRDRQPGRAGPTGRQPGARWLAACPTSWSPPSRRARCCPRRRFRALAEAVDAELVLGNESLDGPRSRSASIVAAMSLPNVLTRLGPTSR